MVTFEEINKIFNALLCERKELTNRIRNLTKQKENNELEKQKNEEAIKLAKEQIKELKKETTLQLNDLVTDEYLSIAQHYYNHCSRFNLQLMFLEKSYEMFKSNLNVYVPEINTKEESLETIGYKLPALEISDSIEKLNTLYLEYEANPEFIKNSLLKAFAESKIKHLRKEIASIDFEIKNSHDIVKSLDETYGQINLKNNLINRILKKRELAIQEKREHYLNLITTQAQEKEAKETEVQKIQENPNLFLEYIETELIKLKLFIEIYNLIKSNKSQIEILEKTISGLTSSTKTCDNTSQNCLEEIDSCAEELETNKQKIYYWCNEISLNPEYVEKLYSLASNNSKKNANEFVEFYEEYLTQSINKFVN